MIVGQKKKMALLQKILKQTDLVTGLGLLGVVAMLILPLPHAILDLGLVVAIASSVIIFLTSVNVSDPLQFSVFPSLLLITTLFRLALSIAATKLILGTGQAGHVIQTFGDVVMGGDFVVGFVAFVILVIVQFMVITHGSGRVSEVVARFTLDAMPGKQMAIDSDLAAGLIDENGARERRKKVKQEADFYGAMDGASKFVKGDAVASILIIVVNIIGGFVMGMLKGKGDVLTILHDYSLLSVGEGLVSQLPALLISTASGLMVTRAGQDRSMGGEVLSQLVHQPKALGVAGIALCFFGLVPGFPLTIFCGVGAGCIAMWRYLTKNPKAAETLSADQNAAPAKPAEAPKPPAPTGPEAVLPLLTVDPIEVEVGFGLTRLADPRSGGDMPERIAATRRQLATDMGFVMPTVRIRDSVHLQPNEYLLRIRGEEIVKAVCIPDNLLAVNSGAGIAGVPGMPARDPVFGLDALWIDPGMRELAERSGYTVIEPTAVITTHLAEMVKSHAAEILSRQDVNTLIENAKGVNGTVVNELVGNVLQVGDIQKVLQHLLRERIPIRDMVTILETMADFGGRVKEPEQLGELVRSAISRTITRQYVDSDGKLYCVTLEPTLERELMNDVTMTSVGSTLAMEPNAQKEFIDRLREQVDSATGQGFQPVVLCGTGLRLALRRLLERHLPQVNVLAYNEVSSQAAVEFVGQVQSRAVAA